MGAIIQGYLRRHDGGSRLEAIDDSGDAKHPLRDGCMSIHEPSHSLAAFDLLPLVEALNRSEEGWPLSILIIFYRKRRE